MFKVLVVDDYETDREAVRRCLANIEDCSLLEAENGRAALNAMIQGRPDLVITDLRMPGMNGLELVEKLRRDYPSLPVILMTSQGSERIAVKALRAGASSYVPKRDLKEHLPETVRQLLQVALATQRRELVTYYVSAINTEVELPSDVQLIAPLVGFLQDNLERIGFGDESVRIRVGIAIMEALSNAIIHGNLELDSDLKRTDPAAFDRMVRERRERPPYAGRRVHFRANESRCRIEYSIEDEGPGFDVTRLPEKQASSILDIAGRGVTLMRSFMDEVRYNAKGNRLVLCKEVASDTE